MPPYVDDIADWLDDESKPHPARFERAYQGFEIVTALYRSGVEGGEVALPARSDELEALLVRVPARKVLMTLPEEAPGRRQKAD